MPRIKIRWVFLILGILSLSSCISYPVFDWNYRDSLINPVVLFQDGRTLVLGGHYSKAVWADYRFNLDLFQGRNNWNYTRVEELNSKVFEVTSPQTKAWIQARYLKNESFTLDLTQGVKLLGEVSHTDVLRDTRDYGFFQGNFLAFPGKTPSTEKDHKDIWSSPDLIHWAKIVDVAPWAGEGRVHNHDQGVEFQGWFYVLASGSAYDGELWRSRDAKNWFKAAEFPGEIGYYNQILVFKDKIWLTTYSSSQRNQLWSTGNGETWELSRNYPQDFSKILTVFEGQLFASYAHEIWSSPEDLCPRTEEKWSSADGLNWGKLSP